MARPSHLTTVLVVLVLLAGCAGSRMSIEQPSQPPSRPVDSIAIAPGSGVLGDAISLELFNRGLTIIDAQDAVGIVGRAGLQEFELTTATGFTVLRESGIDAVLVARAVAAADGTPESASIRITDTRSGRIITGITWQNGHGGTRGSVADRMMRKNLSEAANEIADELVRRLSRERRVVNGVRRNARAPRPLHRRGAGPSRTGQRLCGVGAASRYLRGPRPS